MTLAVSVPAPATTSALHCDVTETAIAFVLIGAVLILSMVASLAFFTAGLLRARNTLAILLQILLGLVATSVLWIVIGFSLSFGESLGGVIGNPFSHIFYRNVSNTDCNPLLAQRVPLSAVAFFEMMFACIAPLLITGAYAERMRTVPSVIFTVLWSIFVYYPVAHSVWHPDGWLKVLGARDFAGGIVLHTSAGSAALISALFIGPRRGFEDHHGEGFTPSNLPLAALGTSGLWLGWFFFNGASAFDANSIALSAMLSTQIAASVCGVLFSLFSWLTHRKPSFVATINGIVAGMAGVTPASGFISSRDTFFLAVVLSLSFFTALAIREKAKIDDALEVSSIHGITGAIGSLAIAFLADTDENPTTTPGIFYGGPWKSFGVQLLAVLVVAAYTSLLTFLILLFIRRIFPKSLRIREDAEEYGLDLLDHGERAYNGLRLDEPVLDQLIDELDDSNAINNNPHPLPAATNVTEERVEQRALLRANMSRRINNADN